MAQFETSQTFLKGVSRRGSREDALDSESFWTLQNCRLFVRGETGQVSRIKGYQQLGAQATDYSGVLDVVTYKDKYVVFYEDASTSGTFHVDIYSTDGTLDDSLSYTDSTTSEGELIVSENTVYISPHNKVLYNDGSWSLQNYISEIPRITNISLTDNSSQASGSIQVTSGASAYSGAKAQGFIRVLANNTAAGNDDVFTITVDGNTTGDITVTYNDTKGDIVDKIITALQAVGAITTDWEIYKGIGGITKHDDSEYVNIKAKSAGATWNGRTITINNSDFNITDYDRKNLRTSEISRFRSDSLNTTLQVSEPSGGVSGVTDLGPLYIGVKFAGEIATENILSTDTANDIAVKIEAALSNNTNFTDEYTASIASNTVTITSLKGNDKYNGSINLFFIIGSQRETYSNVFSATVTDLTGGAVSSGTGTLDNETDYWYKCRYLFVDGHKSITCLPSYINTGTAETVDLTISTPATDIDGSRPKLQVFRKREGAEFFLIDEIDLSADSTNYSDSGESELDILNEQNIIWDKTHRSQAIVDNRLVRGNVKYFDENYNAGAFTVSTTTTSDEKALPKSTKATLYVRPKYENGSEGYFSEIGSVNVTTADKKLTLQQTSLVSNTDKDISELGIYANFLNFGSDETFQFNTPELANQNLSFIDDESDFPSRTTVFFGFKYIEVTVNVNNFSVVRAQGWNEGEDEAGGILIKDLNASGPIGGGLPREITASLFGNELKYVRMAAQQNPDDGTEYVGIYKMDVYESLREAVKTNQMGIRLFSRKTQNLSNDVSDEEIFKAEARVTGFIDKSLNQPQIRFDDESVIISPSDSRIYLEIEESAFDDISNPNVTNYSLKKDYSSTGDVEGEYGWVTVDRFTDLDVSQNAINIFSNFGLGFELVNYAKKSDASMIEYSGDGFGLDNGKPRTTEDATYYLYEWGYSKYELVNKLGFDNTDRLIFLQSKANQTDGSLITIDNTGFTYLNQNSLEYAILEDYNIYQILVLASDINVDRTEFTNQLIWTNPLILGDRYSGGRSIEVVNVFNIDNENGDILKLISLRGNLYGFCQHGIAKLFIGEVAAQQKGGEIFVKSDNFIADYFWLIDSLNNVKENSIIKYKGIVYFTDGEDVYRMSGDQIENISSGRIPVSNDHTYSAKIDPVNYEYHLSDLTDGETWVFNFEFEQWYGPFTYASRKGAFYQDQSVSVVGTKVVEHNTSNTFDGTAFTTLIESVADDTKRSFMDKNWRKFYVGSENDSGATFHYGKDPSSLTSEAFSNLRERNGYKHIGINGGNQNSKTIFWEIDSQDDGFKLQDFGASFNVRRRR